MGWDVSAYVIGHLGWASKEVWSDYVNMGVVGAEGPWSQPK